MAAENKSEPDLGELTDRTGKREFPETEKSPDVDSEGKRVSISSDDIFGREKTMHSINSAQALSEEYEEVSGVEGTELSDGVGKNEYEEAHDMVSSQCGSIDIPVLPESQESKNGDACACNSDSIEACSCRFCTKAAHIWLDINYQDTKARVSALKKSRKEASLAGERSVWRRGVAVEYLTETEYDLMCHWRSLFRLMAEVNEPESNQLEARLLELNGLRDRCKTDLETICNTRLSLLNLLNKLG